ncbi:hypothetical protein [Rufibacter sp. LB8]|uniref:hypothetical protein n=1 Tax=Rufibacter sp. LB8 TaxID=2777781 RepID=UPI00178C45E1|nr:hypothetical protein [Rufibacter sp. LB8]
MSKKVKTLLILLILFFGGRKSYCQDYTTEKQKILNVVINSVQFDSIYFSKRVYIQTNELLSIKSGFDLKREEYKVRFVNRVGAGLVKQYIVLGDFTMARENPQAVRVQIEVMPQNILLNMRLTKNDSEWKIANHLIMYD